MLGRRKRRKRKRRKRRSTCFDSTDLTCGRTDRQTDVAPRMKPNRTKTDDVGTTTRLSIRPSVVSGTSVARTSVRRGVRHSFEENESACFFTTVACITSLQAMARWMERAVESGERTMCCQITCFYSCFIRQVPTHCLRNVRISHISSFVQVMGSLSALSCFASSTDVAVAPISGNVASRPSV